MKVNKQVKANMNGKCHINSYNHSRETKSLIYVGFVVFEKDGLVTAYPHFFNVECNQIIDTTLGGNDYLYYGKKVNAKYSNGNKMFDSELWNTLYKEKKVENYHDLGIICDKYNLSLLNK